MAQTFTVPKITDGPASAGTFNTPLEYIETALNKLQSDTLSIQQAILQWQVPIASDVTAGDLVYYNSEAGHGCYQKAFAASYSNSQGQLMQAASCHVEGLIIAKSATENSATLLRGGYFQDNVINGVIGTGATAGTYYLSSQPGKATLTPGWSIRIPVISYYGDGKFSIINTGFTHVGKADVAIRHIISNTLGVSQAGDTVRVEQPQYTLSAAQYAPYAITGIHGGELSITPVVTKLTAGAGAKISQNDATGACLISLDTLVDKPLPATDFTLNGVQRVADNLLTYSVFPQGTRSTMTMVLPVNFSQSTSFAGNVQVWMTSKGPGTGVFTVQLYWLPYSTSAIQPISLGQVTINSNNASNTALTYIQSKAIENISFDTSGVIIAKLMPNSPPNRDIYVYQAGFKFALEVVSDSQPTSAIDENMIISILQKYLSFNPL